MHFFELTPRKDYDDFIILRIASEDIRSNAKIQADYLSLILSNGLNSITTNLQVLSNSRGVQNYDKDSIILFDAVQKSTNELPDSYMWFDQNGKLLIAYCRSSKELGNTSGTTNETASPMTI